jgi:hypothetical protein
MEIGLTEDLQIDTTRNYPALTNSCNLLLTTAHESSMSSLAVVWQRIPTMPSASVLTSLPFGDCLTSSPQLQTHNS